LRNFVNLKTPIKKIYLEFGSYCDVVLKAVVVSLIISIFLRSFVERNNKFILLVCRFRDLKERSTTAVIKFEIVDFDISIPS